MSEHIYKRHNVSLLLYHIVNPVKYRRIAFSEGVEDCLKKTCNEIEIRYDIIFIEVGADDNHVHFLVQGIPNMSPRQIVQTVKSITAKEIFRLCPEVKNKLWGGQFWSDGYYVNTVSKHGNENVIQEYVKNQGQDNKYVQFHKAQLRLF